MKSFMILVAAMLVFMPPVFAKHKRHRNVITDVKSPVVEEKLDSIVIPHIKVQDAKIETLLAEISRWTGTFDKEGKGLKITFSRKKYPSHTHKKHCVEEIPLITLDMRNVTLRTLLNTIAVKSGCSYHTVKDHLEFIHVPVKNHKGNAK